jgi:O-antigen/teichoic acid export membrane protein
MNEKYVGLYNAAIPTVNLLLVIPLAVVSLFIPVTAKLLAKNKIMELKKSYFISSEWIFFINFPIFLILFVFPQQVLNVLFGAVYSATAQALSILAIGFFMYASAHPSLKMLELQKDTKFYLISTGLAALTNILLNLWLIPLYGLNGAAVASAVSLIMLFILVTYKVNQRGNYLTYSNGFMKSGFIAMALLGVIYIFAKIFFSIITPIMLIPLTCIYLGSYALLLFLFVLRTEEKEIISKIVTKVRNILRVS